MKFFYSLGVNAYTCGIRIASLWSSKARDWIRGRKNQWEKIENFKTENAFWFHCASLGEFEQGRPVMERLKEDEACQIVVSFFSPSGYKVRKDYPGADLIFYLPKDSSRNAKRLLTALQPKKIFFVKYEFWASYIFEAQRSQIPVYSIAALFREKQSFFKFFGGYQRRILKTFDKILVQNRTSQKLLNSINVDSEICGDTRFDRVMTNASRVEQYSTVKAFCKNEKVIVCGSVWGEDITVISGVLAADNDLKIIIAPHELSEAIYQKIEVDFGKKTVRYSELTEESDAEILIIDNIGILMNLYQYGELAYIGGAFGKGLHNILEPAAFGLPVIFGPKTDKFPEAKLFVQQGIGIQIKDSNSFKSALEVLKAESHTEKVLSFMNSKRGATEIIIQRTK